MKKIRLISLVMALILCAVFAANAATFVPGTYEGEGKGRNDQIKVSVTVDDKGITEIKVLEHKETDGFGEKAFEGVTKAIIDGQTLKVDAVAGATLSSNGLLIAVADALTKGKMDPKELNYVPPVIPDPSELIKELGNAREGIRRFEFTTQGITCSTKITFSIGVKDMVLEDDLIVYDGCDGNSRGFSALAAGQKIDDVILKFAGIPCHASNGSSCPDQVSKALNEARFLIVGERLAIPAK